MRKILEIIMAILYKRGQQLRSLPHIIVMLCLLFVFAHLLPHFSWFTTIISAIFLGAMFAVCIEKMCEIDNKFFPIDKDGDDDIIG